MNVMEGQRVAKSKGGGKLPWIVAGTASTALLAAYIGVCVWASGRDSILPNVSVAGLDVSNMTVEQAQRAVETAVTQQGGDVDLTLTYEGMSETLNAGDLSVDSAQSVQNAWQVGRENFFIGGPQLLGHMLGASTQVPLALPEGEPAMEQLFSAMEQTVADRAGGNEYRLEGDQLVMTKGAAVATVDWEKVRQDAARSLQEGFEERFSGTSSRVNKTVVLSAGRGEEIPEPDFDQIYASLAVEPRDAQLDPETMEVSDHVVGVDFDVQTLKTAYQKAQEGETFSIPVTVLQPKVTREDLEGKLFRDLLGEATTTVTGTAARKSNVKLAAARCNGTILLPGEEFSYNNTAGAFSVQNGYLPAPVYVAGRSEDGVGGGVCQPSSTIYYAVLHTTLEIVERRNHQFAVSYMPAGMDATVTGSSIDFRFKNNTDYPVKIVTSSYDSGKSRKLSVKIYGTNVDGRYGVPTSTVYDVVEPTTTYEPDPTVPRGSLVLEREQNPYTGKKAHTYRTICEADGTVVEKQDMGVSKYKMRTRIYYYNPADGDPTTWVGGKPPTPVDPGTTTPPDPGVTDPGTETPNTPADPGVTDPSVTDPSGGTAEPDTQPPRSDSGLNPIDPNAVPA